VFEGFGIDTVDEEVPGLENVDGMCSNEFKLAVQRSQLYPTLRIVDLRAINARIPNEDTNWITLFSNTDR
jgi:hypothetical protein